MNIIVAFRHEREKERVMKAIPDKICSYLFEFTVQLSRLLFVSDLKIKSIFFFFLHKLIVANPLGSSNYQPNTLKLERRKKQRF